MQQKWFEDLPRECPPADAMECGGRYYRVSWGNPATTADFFSQRRLAPEKVFLGEGIDECVVRAVSVFADLEDACRLLKHPKFKNAKVALLKLEQQDGKIKKTFKRSHHSWWRSSMFDVSSAKIIA